MLKVHRVRIATTQCILCGRLYKVFALIAFSVHEPSAPATTTESVKNPQSGLLALYDAPESTAHRLTDAPRVVCSGPMIYLSIYLFIYLHSNQMTQ